MHSCQMQLNLQMHSDPIWGLLQTDLRYCISVNTDHLYATDVNFKTVIF
jgi:hypothetical protein